jgi:preprotein translocase subunit SecG
VSDAPTGVEEAEETTPPTDSEATPTDAADAEQAEETAAPSRTLIRSLVVLCIVFFLGTVAMAILAARQHSELQHSKDARAGVENVASRFASAVLTYDYRDLDKTKNAVLGLSAGKFKTDYEQNFPGLSALFTSTKGQSTATVKDVFVSGIDNNTASAIVVLDERGQGTSGQRLNVDWYLRLSLVKVKGDWRVDDLINLNFAGQGAAPVPGGTTPTTAPPK